jgi:hypothetical protein
MHSTMRNRNRTKVKRASHSVSLTVNRPRPRTEPLLRISLPTPRHARPLRPFLPFCTHLTAAPCGLAIGPRTKFVRAIMATRYGRPSPARVSAGALRVASIAAPVATALESAQSYITSAVHDPRDRRLTSAHPSSSHMGFTCDRITIFRASGGKRLLRRLHDVGVTRPGPDKVTCAMLLRGGYPCLSVSPCAHRSRLPEPHALGAPSETVHCRETSQPYPAFGM